MERIWASMNVIAVYTDWRRCESRLCPASWPTTSALRLARSANHGRTPAVYAQTRVPQIARSIQAGRDPPHSAIPDERRSWQRIAELKARSAECPDCGTPDSQDADGCWHIAQPTARWFVRPTWP